MIATLLTFLSLVISAKIWPPLASDGAVLKKYPLSSKVVNPGDVADGDDNMFNDYGQSYDTRQGFRKDFNPELTYKRNPAKKRLEKQRGIH